MKRIPAQRKRILPTVIERSRARFAIAPLRLLRFERQKPGRTIEPETARRGKMRKAKREGTESVRGGKKLQDRKIANRAGIFRRSIDLWKGELLRSYR